MEEQLTKKQRRELKKQEKQELANKNRKKEQNKSLMMWLAVIAGIALIVWGIIASSGDNSSVNVSSSISDIVEQDHVKGNPDASIVIMEYSDFQCPACKAYFPIIKQLMSEYSDDIAFVYRHYPLTSIHANAEPAARAAEAASVQGKFWEMHDKLFENQSEWSELSTKLAEDKFAEYAGDIGLDVDKFKIDLGSKAIKERVKSDSQSALRAGLNSTPTFFINGEKIKNPRGLNEFKFFVDNLLQR